MMRQYYYPEIYRITKTQLRNADVFILVLGALYNQFRKLYHIQNLNRVELNEMLKLFTSIKTGWFYITHNPNDDAYCELDSFARGFLLRDQLKDVVDYISKNDHIELPKITAPDFVKHDDIYLDYIQGIVNIQFYET